MRSQHPSSLLKTVVIACLSLPAFATSAKATDLRVVTGRVERNARGVRVSASVSWSNAWRNGRNHDAVWLFVKVRPRGAPDWTHARLRTVSANPQGTSITCVTSADRVGTFCAPVTTYRGPVSATVALEIDREALPESVRQATDLEARAFGIEMVYVPAGPFSVGDPDPKSLDHAALYRSDASGGVAGTFRITSEDAIRVGPSEGALHYRSANQYQGDRGGPIPAEFPKGTRAFYVMKYEILQGQYAAFLNTIPRHAAARAPNVPKYHAERGTIRLTGEEYVAERPDRPANFTSWDDGAAFADWAGLRPMTELEFTKAARGSAEPVAGEFPWGTSSKARLLRRVGLDGDLIRAAEADESRLTNATREVLGASYYWVMDLAGSVWEKAVTIGHPKGRAFRGTHGDGTLGEHGLATNPDWPAGDDEGGGYGYRGGGYYEKARERAGDRDFNPYSPLEWRDYGSWGGAPRSVAYGFRAARTADAGR